MFSLLVFAAALQTFSIQDSVPHDPSRYTQGLFFQGQELIESSGTYGGSGLYRMKRPGGPTLDSAHLDARYFGEGSIQLDRDIIWLTWRENRAFIYDAGSFTPRDSFFIPTEGWGLALWNGMLLMSNGSAELLCLSPSEHQVIRTIAVKDGDRPVDRLNELEVVGNTLYANIWGSDSIAVIDLNRGRVKAWLDFSEVARKVRRRDARAEVLNGIAWDGKNLWVTGKYWPVMYEIRLK